MAGLGLRRVWWLGLQYACCSKSDVPTSDGAKPQKSHEFSLAESQINNILVGWWRGTGQHSWSFPTDGHCSQILQPCGGGFTVSSDKARVPESGQCQSLTSSTPYKPWNSCWMDRMILTLRREAHQRGIVLAINKRLQQIAMLHGTQYRGLTAGACELLLYVHVPCTFTLYRDWIQQQQYKRGALTTCQVTSNTCTSTWQSSRSAPQVAAWSAYRDLMMMTTIIIWRASYSGNAECKCMVCGTRSENTTKGDVTTVAGCPGPVSALSLTQTTKFEMHRTILEQQSMAMQSGG